MSEMMTYALQMVACSALFTVFYRVVLQGRISFRVARCYLLASPVVAAVIPALDIPVWRVAPIEIPFNLLTVPSSEAVLSAPLPAPDRSSMVLWAIWGFGLALLAIMMVRQMVRIAAIRRRAELHPADGFRVALSGEVPSPFSFLGTVFVGRDTPPGEVRQIVTHEASHIRHRHSVEKLAMEAIKSALWFNPFAWWTARMLGEVHEFEADRDVLDGGSTVEEYLPLILRQTFGYVPELTVGLGDSLTKKRFLMMKNKMKLTKRSWLRVAGVLPLAAGAMLLFSFTSRPPEIVYVDVPEEVVVAPVVPAPVPVPVPVPAPAPAPQVPQTPPSPPTDQDTPLLIVEEMPTFEGGSLNDFRHWVQSRVNYPREAAQKGVHGLVALKFVIERDGSLTNIEVLNSPDASLSAEAVRVIGLSPKWSPGKQRGNPVRVQYILPVQFSLTNDSQPAAEVVRPAPDPTPRMVLDGRFAQGQPLVLVDGEEVDALGSVDMNKVASISVIKSEEQLQQYGDRGRYGVIIITTKKEGDVGNSVELSATPNVPMKMIYDLKQSLLAADVTTVTNATPPAE